MAKDNKNLVSSNNNKQENNLLTTGLQFLAALLPKKFGIKFDAPPIKIEPLKPSRDQESISYPLEQPTPSLRGSISEPTPSLSKPINESTPSLRGSIEPTQIDTQPLAEKIKDIPEPTKKAPKHIKPKKSDKTIKSTPEKPTKKRLSIKKINKIPKKADKSFAKEIRGKMKKHKSRAAEL